MSANWWMNGYNAALASEQVPSPDTLAVVLGLIAEAGVRLDERERDLFVDGWDLGAQVRRTAEVQS